MYNWNEVHRGINGRSLHPSSPITPPPTLCPATSQLAVSTLLIPGSRNRNKWQTGPALGVHVLRGDTLYLSWEFIRLSGQRSHGILDSKFKMSQQLASLRGDDILR
ncbi:hypothetical protein PIB30_037893 [Stylosanthes scabra]|uniref:Uncharacterized protein n=1 Tax=Stylosanthes scabra TaxID=79078 RepID=A0ABU6ZC06_9FABA|nr:hypothetical protein [Stylosanthes scabra]